MQCFKHAEDKNTVTLFTVLHSEPFYIGLISVKFRFLHLNNTINIYNSIEDRGKTKKIDKQF